MLDITPDTMDSFFTNAPYLVHLDGRQVVADPRDKGEPGDTVVVWPKRRGPMVLRRLARCEPFNKYWFASDDGVVAVPVNRVVAIHKVVLS